jgi:ribokinase
MVVVFGSINVDLVAHVERIPAPGETISGQSFSSIPGGKGANQALAAQRAGAQVKMFGAIGRDGFAATALANLESSGVDLAGVVAVDTSTGVALIHVEAQGENAITVIAGANAMARSAQIPDSALGSATTLLLQLEVPVAEIVHLCRRANGARVILNAAPASALPEDLLHGIDVLIVNETEAATLGVAQALPTAPKAFAHAAAARYRCVVVVTLGAGGALAAGDGNEWIVKAPATTVVDTTGAGDAFAGAFAAALDRGATLRDATADGVAAGSLACTGRGAQGALPTRRAIQELAATL